MNIIITSEKLIHEIQDEFNKLFPFLKIEFFIKSVINSKETINKISSLLTIGNGDKTRGSKEMEVSPYMTVKEFENNFENKFGMYAQLYRKSGNLWQEITITDNWTMQQQDEAGNEISTIINRDSLY